MDSMLDSEPAAVQESNQFYKRVCLQWRRVPALQESLLQGIILLSVPRSRTCLIVSERAKVQVLYCLSPDPGQSPVVSGRAKSQVFNCLSPDPGHARCIWKGQGPSIPLYSYVYRSMTCLVVSGRAKVQVFYCLSPDLGQAPWYLEWPRVKYPIV